MKPSLRSLCVLPPNLVLYRDEKIVSPRLKRLASMIPSRPWEKRPPGEEVPKGILNREACL